MNCKFWGKRLAEIEPYVPGEQPRDRKYIKLNTNENPYPPSPKALEAAKAAADGTLRLYPDPECLAVRQLLAQQHGVTPAQVFLGNGSDEILAFAFMAFMDDETPAIFPDITYSFYEVWASITGIRAQTFPVAEDFSIPPAPMQRNCGTVVLTNPNAPTSLALGLKEIEQVLQANPDHVVIVDEAYVDFGAESAVPLLAKYDNLLVVQTGSKSRSLAGMRVGFAFGSENLIAALNAVKNSINSYTLDRVALAAAEASLRDTAYFEATCAKVIATRERIVPQLREMGFQVPESRSNFLFIRHPRKDGKELFTRLRENGILVRYFAKPRIDQYLRVTVGTDEEMDTLVRVLRTLTEA